MRLALRFTFLFFVSLVLAPIFIHAQEPATRQPESSAANRSLERRIEELEETIRRMQVDRPRVFGDPNSLPQSLPQAQQPEGSPLDGVMKPSPSTTASSEEKSDPKDGSENKKEGEKKTAVAGWDNGFFLRSSDKCFNLRITGQIQADYRTFLDDVDFV